MQPLTLGRANLLATALVFEAFGVWALAAPENAAAALGLTFNSADGPTAIRAVYGGYLIGGGALFAWAACKVERVGFGLTAVLFIVGPIFLARLSGLALVPPSSPAHLQRAALEVLSIIATTILLVTRA